jgi:hypothetical protein
VDPVTDVALYIASIDAGGVWSLIRKIEEDVIDLALEAGIRFFDQLSNRSRDKRQFRVTQILAKVINQIRKRIGIQRDIYFVRVAFSLQPENATQFRLPRRSLFQS